MKKRACDIIIETLIAHSITDCFAVTGGGAMYLDNALYRHPAMHVVFNHHEQACAMAAEAYARYSGKMAVVCVTSGPGGTNTLTGVMGAYVDSIPMVVVSGQVRYAASVPATGLALRYRGTQEFDVVNTVRTMTKYAKLVTDPLSAKYEVEKAISIAMKGRRGPVWLDIPLDVQSAFVDEELLPSFDDSTQALRPSEADVSFVFDSLAAAKRPLVLLGRGAAFGEARTMARSIANRFHVPVLGSSSGADILYRGHPFYYGTTGSFGPRAGNFIIQNADFILSIGCSLGFSTTGFAPEFFAPKAKVVAVDADEAEMMKPGVNLSRRIFSDAAEFLKALLAVNHTVFAPSDWLCYCDGVYRRFSPFEAKEGKSPDERVCSYAFWYEFHRVAKPDAIIVLGNNTAIIGGLQSGLSASGQRIINNKNCGSMGYDVPASIGAAIASKKEVTLITGDGSVMMNLQELQTIVHYGLNIKVIIFENGGYNAIRQTAKNFFNGEEIGCSPSTGVSFPSFEALAKSFSMPFLECPNNRSLRDSLTRLYEMPGSALLVVRELLDDPIVPKAMSRPMPDGSFSAPALQDMSPFLDSDELNRWMSISKEESDV